MQLLCFYTISITRRRALLPEKSLGQGGYAWRKNILAQHKTVTFSFLNIYGQTKIRMQRAASRRERRDPRPLVCDVKSGSLHRKLCRIPILTPCHPMSISFRSWTCFHRTPPRFVIVTALRCADGRAETIDPLKHRISRKVPQEELSCCPKNLRFSLGRCARILNLVLNFKTRYLRVATWLCQSPTCAEGCGARPPSEFDEGFPC